MFGTKLSSIQLLFLRKVVKQNHTDVTLFCMKFEKIGCGLLREAFWGEGGALLAEREGENKKGLVLKNAGNIFTTNSPTFSIHCKVFIYGL